jgi:hypothetical protein
MEKEVRIRISDLDLSVLEFVSDMKFVSAGMVGERFFKGKGERYPQKRLRDFVKNGLVFSVSEWGGKKLNYLITEEGSCLLQRKGFDVVFFGMKGIDLKNYEHDKVLSMIRIKLEARGIVKDWVSERVIRNRQDFLKVSDKEKIIADAYCKSLEKGTDLIIEFENSRKSNARIKKLLKNYQMYLGSSKKEDEKVLFFFASESLLASYKKIYADSNCSFSVSFIEISDLGIVKEASEYRRNSYVH